MAVDFGNGPQIKSRAIQGQKVDVVSGGSDNAWGALAEGIAKAGDGIAAGINAKASKTDQALGSMDKPKKTNLDKRIDKANEQGKTAEATRLTGKKERRTQRDAERAKREAQRNKERMVETTRRSESKTEKFKQRRAGDDGKFGTFDDTRPFDIAQPFARTKEFNPTNVEFKELIPQSDDASLGGSFSPAAYKKFSTIAKKL